MCANGKKETTKKKTETEVHNQMHSAHHDAHKGRDNQITDEVVLHRTGCPGYVLVRHENDTQRALRVYIDERIAKSILVGNFHL